MKDPIPNEVERQINEHVRNLERDPICWICDSTMEPREGKWLCVSCDKAYRDSRKELHAALATVEQLRAERLELLESVNSKRDALETAGHQLAGLRSEKSDAVAELAQLREELARVREVLRQLLPDWSEDDWKWAESHPKGAIAGEFDYRDALAIRAALKQPAGGQS